jgi:hypothetical protein
LLNEVIVCLPILSFLALGSRSIYLHNNFDLAIIHSPDINKISITFLSLLLWNLKECTKKFSIAMRSSKLVGLLFSQQKFEIVIPRNMHTRNHCIHILSCMLFCWLWDSNKRSIML